MAKPGNWCLSDGFFAQIGWRDSLYESSVLPGENEQLDTDDLQDQKLVRLQPSPKTAWFAVDPLTDRALRSNVPRGWFDAEMSWEAKHSGRRGRQQAYSDAAIQACLTIKVLFGLPLRQTSGFMESLMKSAGLNWTVPDFRTLCRRQKTSSVAIPFRGSSGPLHLLIDSTGIKAEGERNGTHVSMAAPNAAFGARSTSGLMKKHWKYVPSRSPVAASVTHPCYLTCSIRSHRAKRLAVSLEMGLTIPANATMQLQLAMPMLSFHRVKMRSCGSLTHPELGRESKLSRHQSIRAVHYGGK